MIGTATLLPVRFRPGPGPKLTVQNRCYHHSCTVDGNHIIEFLIFGSQLGRRCQLASRFPVTTFSWRLPCISKWHLKCSLFSWHHPCLWKIDRWIVVKWLLHLTFSWLLLDWLWGFRSLVGGCGFNDDISEEVVVKHCFICSIRWCVLCPFSEYHISGGAKRVGQWVVYEILRSWHTLPNEFARSGSGIQHVLSCFWNVHESQIFEHVVMLQQCLRCMTGLIWSPADHSPCLCADLSIDHHW